MPSGAFAASRRVRNSNAEKLVGRGAATTVAAVPRRFRKVAPDKWEFGYAVGKRRAGKAPEGSGVPVGTEYHWYILAHQIVRKLSANDYSTSITGVKHKMAHKRATGGKWSASEAAQRRHLIRILEEMISDLKGAPQTLEPADLEESKALDRMVTRSEREDEAA